MAFHGFLFTIRLFALVTALASVVYADDIFPTLVASLNRSSFPSGFMFGAGSASYQNEGAAFEGGKGMNIWDNFTHKYPEKIADRSNGDVAIDQYHRYEEDIKIMKKMNFDAYRFSISWSRVLPKGKLSGGKNEEGIRYYNNLINELLANDLKPFVTIFHWDLPQALEDEYDGFLNSSIVNDFQDYAELCFQEFGDRVKYWNTFNEPFTFSKGGYASGNLAPGRCSDPHCTGGDSGREPYLVTHHQLLAHAHAVDVYKKRYQASQNGTIGITLVSNWFIPLVEDREDQSAAERAIDFMFGWFMGPLTHGEYPESMRSLVGNRLPPFSKEESKLVSGSYDFIGLNYYTTYYVFNVPGLIGVKPNYLTDAHANTTDVGADGRPLGPQAASAWLYVYPKGILDLLLYTKNKYNDPLIYITENGMSEYNDPTLSVKEALMDTFRIDYCYRHLYYVLSAIKNGTNVKGYFAWSYADDFEWSSGYTVRFGIIFVDFKKNLTRHEKLSAQWLQYFLQK